MITAPCEFDVLCMLVSPASVHEIAQRLHLSVRTIHNLHYQSKLGVDSDIELTRLAMSWGLDLAPALDNNQPAGSQSPTSAVGPRPSRPA